MLSIAVPFIYYTSSGVLGEPYAYPWLVLATSEIAVYVNDSLALSGYTVTGLGNPAGGTVVFNNPQQAGAKILLRRITATTQPTDLLTGGQLLADALEAAFDRQGMLIQDTREIVTLTPAFAPTVIEPMRTALLPTPTPLRLLGFNALGTGWTIFDSAIITITPDPISGLIHGKTTQTVNSVDDVAVLSAAALVPAGARCQGVTYRCPTSFGVTRGLTSVDIGGFGLEDGWGQGIGITAGTVTGEGQFRRGDQPTAVGAETVTLVANGGNFDATGQCKLTVSWRTQAPDA